MPERSHLFYTMLSCDQKLYEIPNPMQSYIIREEIIQFKSWQTAEGISQSSYYSCDSDSKRICTELPIEVRHA